MTQRELAELVASLTPMTGKGDRERYWAARQLASGAGQLEQFKAEERRQERIRHDLALSAGARDRMARGLSEEESRRQVLVPCGDPLYWNRKHNIPMHSTAPCEHCGGDPARVDWMEEGPFLSRGGPLASREDGNQLWDRLRELVLS